jgi:hypothetical protein
MIKHLITILHNFAVTLPLAWRICIFISWMAFVIMTIIVFVLSLDIFYNKTKKQYRYNIILDRVIPFVALLSPSLTLLKVSPTSLSWIEKFSYLIIIHIIVLIPLMAYWSTLRGWFHDNNKTLTAVTWLHPRFFFVLSLAMIYPMISGIYFTGIRYLRLGQQLHMSDVFIVITSPEHLAFLFVFLCAFFNLWCYFILFFGNFLVIRNYLWQNTSLLVYSLHLELLTYNVYFKIMEKIFKLYFVWFSVVSLNNYFSYNSNNLEDTVKNSNWLRRLSYKIFYKPYLFYIMIFVILIVEIYIFQNTTHIYYFLFWFPILLSIYKVFSAIGLSAFTRDVCKVDYLNQNLNNIRYARLFWILIENPDFFFGLSRELPDNVLQDWQKQHHKIHLQNQVYSMDLIDKLYRKINKKYRTNFYIRIKVAYYKTYNLRFNQKFIKKCL